MRAPLQALVAKDFASSGDHMNSHQLTGGAVRALLTTLGLIVAVPASAQWAGKGEAGVALASGNTDTKTANAKLALTRKDDQWEHGVNFAGLYVRNAGETSARRWEFGAQTRYSFSPQTYWFGAGRYEKDRFSGFDHQGTFNTGLGRKFIDSDDTKASAQIGIGYKFSETNPTLLEPADKESSAAGVAALDFSHRLTETTTVFDKFSTEYTSDNTFMQNDVGVAVKVSDRLALSLAYGLRRNSNPPAGFKKVDTLTTANLVFEIK
jgi:putative salt-induced outer membrane protein